MRKTCVALATFSYIAAVALLSGCSSSTDDQESGVTIKHNLGETTIDGTPERIVTLGNQWLDSTLAMGITPVGYVDNVSIGAASRPAWEPESLDDAKPLNMGGDLVEQIAALEPDLILVPGFMVDQAMYENLSKLAPTLGPVTAGVQVDNWADEVTTLGEVLGKEDEAKKVIAGVDDKVAAVAAANPGLAGKSFLTCMLTGPAQLMVLADPKDGSAALFEKLGMHIPQHIVDEAPAGGRLALSPERLGDLDADLLVCGAMPALKEKFTQLPGYSELPSVRSGGIAFVDVALISAINTPTALSLPYVLEQLEPTFAAVGS